MPYSRSIGDRYPRDGECEIGICRRREAARLASARRRHDRAARELAALDAALPALAARKAALLALAPSDEAGRRARRRELDSVRRQLRDGADRAAGLRDVVLPMAERMAAPVPPGPLVFDHCHAHGWVRGLVCVPCNNRVGSADAGRLEPRWYTGAERAALRAHQARCPGCLPAGAAGAAVPLPPA